MLDAVGVKTVKLPAKSPNLNAYAERFVRSIKYEYLNKFVLLGENHLRTVVRAYVAHYHLERNHQGLDNEHIVPFRAKSRTEGDVQCRERLGGTPRYYRREAGDVYFGRRVTSIAFPTDICRKKWGFAGFGS